MPSVLLPPYHPWAQSLRLWLLTNTVGTLLLSGALIIGFGNSFFIVIPIGFVAGAASAVAIPVVALLLPVSWQYTAQGPRWRQFLLAVSGACLIAFLGFLYCFEIQAPESKVMLGFASPYLVAALGMGILLYWPILSVPELKASC